MEEEKSLREWAKKIKIYDLEAWKIFLKNEIVPFYKDAYTLYALYNYLKSDKIIKKASLEDIEDETLKKQIRVAIYGGIGPNKDPNLSFAKFMYDNFGICVENAPSFEESIKRYQELGDQCKVNTNPNSWINSIPINELEEILKKLIEVFCKKLNIQISEIGINPQSSYPFLEFITPEELLPQPKEEPNELIKLINDFKQRGLNLSRYFNPFTTFVYYSRIIPLIGLMQFLECNQDNLKNLINFLGLKALSMVDMNEVNLPTNNPINVIMVYEKNSSTNLIYLILQLKDYLERVNPEIKETIGKIYLDTINEIHVVFEPWENYKPFFITISNIEEEHIWDYGCVLKVENGKIISSQNFFGNIKFQTNIWLRDFLIKISPFINTGLIELDLDYSGDRYQSKLDAINLLHCHPLVKEWAKRVIENEGKT